MPSSIVIIIIIYIHTCKILFDLSACSSGRAELAPGSEARSFRFCKLVEGKVVPVQSVKRTIAPATFPTTPDRKSVV